MTFRATSRRRFKRCTPGVGAGPGRRPLGLAGTCGTTRQRSGRGSKRRLRRRPAMAHIEDRWYRTVVVDGKSAQVPKPGCGKGKRYRVRYFGPDGRERSESFPDKQKRPAQQFLAQVQA